MALATVSALSTPRVSGEVAVPLPNLEFTLHSRSAPSKLPADHQVPIALHLGVKIRNRDYSIPPQLRQVQFEGDKHGELDVTGLPTCGRRKLPTGPPPAKKCADALVGRGYANVLSAFPETTPMNIETELTVYNAGARGEETRLWIYGYLWPIQAGPIYVPVKVRKVSNGVYGWKAIASVPTIFEGHGSITDLNLTLQKRVLAASCPGGKLSAKSRSTFSDGTVVESTSLQRCR
jgi:hypothetical protein